jgi:hypothetical protein
MPLFSQAMIKDSFGKEVNKEIETQLNNLKI